MTAAKSRRIAAAVAMALALEGCWLFGSQYRPELYTPLFAAAEAGELAAVEAQLAQHPGLARARRTDEGWDGETLLHVAAGRGHAELARRLLARGAAVDALTRSGYTALHMAAKNGDVGVIAVLLEHGARINRQDPRRRTALDLAREQHHDAAAAVLAEHGGKAGSSDFEAGGADPGSRHSPEPSGRIAARYPPLSTGMTLYLRTSAWFRQ